MNGNVLFLIVLIGLLIVVGVFLFLPHWRAWTRANPPSHREYSGPTYRDDDRNWVGGFLYNNPDDPDLFVPKRYGLGWTVNFGHPQGKLVLVGTLLVPVVVAILSVVLTGKVSPLVCHPSGCH